jgi:hypothetical protein
MNRTCAKCGQGLETEGTCAACGHETRVPAAQAPSTGRSRLAWAAVLAFPFLGLLAGLALPFQIRFAARPRQSECEGNLKSWFVQQRTRQQGVALELDTVGFSPERGNRYAYFAGPAPLEDRSRVEVSRPKGAVGIGVDTWRHETVRPITFEDLPPDVARITGLSGGQCPQGPDCAITLVCAGNIDQDATLDVWSISTEDRIGPDGESSPAGELMRHVDDVAQ